MFRRRSATALCLFLAAILTSVGQVSAQPQDAKVRVAQEDDIREAVLRFVMHAGIDASEEIVHSAKNPDAKAAELRSQTFFISINGGDPSADFLQRFRDIPRTVKKASLSQYPKGSASIYDSHTHKKSIIFHADSVTWLSNDSAEVFGGYTCGGLCGISETFIVRRVNGAWIAKEKKGGTVWVQ